MRHRVVFQLLTLLTALAVVPIFPLAGAGAERVTPVGNHGAKWRIAYYEGGAYTDYGDSMRAIIAGLMDLGWIAKAPLPHLTGDTAKPYWQWLATESRSPYLSFRSEDAYSAQWSDSVRAAMRAQVLEKLKSGKIDLIIAMGTWAGQDLANDLHRVPTTVVSTSNPIQAHIIMSADDSGFDHVTARVDVDRYRRQIRMFHRLVRFRKLGVAYEDTPDGRIYSALPELKEIAAERGFELVECRFNDAREDREAAGRECLDCMRQLAETADAIYLTALLTVDEKIDDIVRILNDARIPSFSMNGSKHVADGVLMSFSTDEGYKAQGMYDAGKIAKVLNGSKPRELEQRFPDPLDIALNLDTARAIGFTIPGSVMRIAHEIYGDNKE